MPAPNKMKRLKLEAGRCQRCGGRMIPEKFFGVNNTFWGWPGVICEEILDPAILLHRLNQNADLAIPEERDDLLNLLRIYSLPKTKEPILPLN